MGVAMDLILYHVLMNRDGEQKQTKIPFTGQVRTSAPNASFHSAPSCATGALS